MTIVDAPLSAFPVLVTIYPIMGVNNEFRKVLSIEGLYGGKLMLLLPQRSDALSWDTL